MSATTFAPPSHPQHLQALARANAVRLARAELKRRIGEGRAPVADVLLACPPEAEGMTVAELLKSQHRWGGTRCRRFLVRMRISETKTVGSLTQRQRREIASALG